MYRADIFQHLTFVNTIHEMMGRELLIVVLIEETLHDLAYDAHASTRHPAKHREQGSDLGA